MLQIDDDVMIVIDAANSTWSAANQVSARAAFPSVIITSDKTSD